MAASALFRKECFEWVGTFNEAQRIGVFIEWYMRAADKNLKHELISDKVLRRRIHGNNMTTLAKHSHQEYFRIIKDALIRRNLAVK